MFNFAKPALLSAALITGAVAPVLAADYYEPPVEVPVAHGGWYLRGHIGMSNQRVGELYNVLFDTTDTVEWLDEGDFDSAPIFSIGVGYQFNNWLRGDVTAEYRGKSSFSALDRYETTDDSDPATFDGLNEYTARKSEWLFMANAYADLGKWHGISPYVGAGIGASRNTIHNFRDRATDPSTGAQTSLAYGADHSEWDLAWALHAGVGIKATDRLMIDLGYSFLHLGDGQSGDIVASDGTNDIDNPMHFRDITSHDVKFGLRYAFH